MGQSLISRLEFEDFVKQGYKRVPLILAYDIQQLDVARLFESLPGSQKTLFETQHVNDRERFSFMGLDPAMTIMCRDQVLYIEGKPCASKPLSALQKVIDSWHAPVIRDIVELPYWGGALGFFSYEANRLFEPSLLSSTKASDIGYDFGFYVYDQVIALDYKLNQLYLVVSGVDYDKVAQSLDQFSARVLPVIKNSRGSVHPSVKTCDRPLEINSNFTKASYLQTIEKVKDYIKLGHTYQVNMSQRLSLDTTVDSFLVYKALREINPVSFAAYMSIGDFSIVCGSPERLVKVQQQDILSRPIAGTRRRGSGGEEQQFINELKQDPKERSEHDMLVDLVRNDLGRVCEFGTVHVRSYADIVQYAHVMHLESDVCGKLTKSARFIDVMAALFPGGTITGVPKIRTMEIISELEPNSRGLYTGSMGYINFNGDYDFNIVIRSLWFDGKQVFAHVGGGITYDCDGKREYAETMNKARSQLQALSAVHLQKQSVL